jgi:hypothetical protein
MSKRFYQIEIGQQFYMVKSENTNLFTKVSKSEARTDGAWANTEVHPQRLVSVVETTETVDLDELDFHTFDFTSAQLAEVISQIVARAQNNYGEDRIDAERLRKGLYAAHANKPIRLIALLNACAVDFPKDVLYGVYRHYDPTTDSIKGGWTAQHAEEHEPDIFDLLFGRR